MCPPRRWRSWSIGATRRRSAPPSSGSSRGARPLACTPRQVRPSMSGVPSGVLRRLPIIAWTFVSGPTNRSRRTASRSKPARSLADAARCCASSATPDNLEPAALYLYRDWLPASDEEARDFPIYCQRLSFFPEVPEHEAVAELFLPLKQRPLTAA